ncbi:MAG: hypothetical protein HOU81_09140 [Hamadaea sp.]|uniref:hypothetical protein n=1 Tax=Hamadaea sp. TaxID=2024425 RepID=UPI00180CE6E7|nr:hypothetical protein [Hamadaea sp.]NUR70973.1 hypothetical protein [Hamadaea sp.]NUT20084.1 hypothetical protein [Hamadaea sp.]
MEFEVHIGRLGQWSDRLDDTGTALAQPKLVAAPAGWAAAAALSTWETALVGLLRAIGEQTVHTGDSVRACAAGYRSADRS